MPLVHHQCRFDAWLLNEGKILHAGQKAFRAIEPLHRQVHALATELCERHSKGHRVLALGRLDELFHLRDALLEQLKALATAD